MKATFRLGMMLLVVLVLCVWPRIIRLPVTFAYYRILPAFGTSDAECVKDIERHAVIHQPIDLVPEQKELGCFLTEGIAAVAATTYAQIGFNSLSSPAVVSSCRLLRALLEFEEESIQPLAQHYFGQKVVRIQHMGAYNCRTQKGSRVMSEHSYGLAIDLSGFVLENGNRIRMKEYSVPNSPYYSFLHDISEAACKKFGTVLTSRYDDNHLDHFHLSMGLFGKCVY